MRNGFFIIGIVFAVTLAYIVGNRLSNEALAVVLGTVCGISASLPVSLALFIATSKNWGCAEAVLSRQETYAPPAQPVPPLIVLAQPTSPVYAPPLYPTPLSDVPRPREFKIIGEE